MNEAISLRNLNYSYTDLPVLKNISFSIKQGEFFIIIGPNGSGKTTLIKVVSGLIRHQRGSLNIFEQPINSYSRKALAVKIALVPQMVLENFPFTVLEIVLMGRSPHQGILGLQSEKDFSIANRAMEFTGVKHLKNRKLEHLSGGERQRVFIARAICQEPQIILLDEPTSSLDIAHQLRVMDLMEKLKNEMGFTIIMVSHDVNLAAMYSDRILLLKAGEIVNIGKPDEILTLQILKETYGCRLLVDESPVGKFPRITLVPEKRRDKL